MGENLVIVESPAKAKTIEKFLGKDYVVRSSFGHIRDLSKKKLGIQIDNGFQPVYEIPTDKKKVVDELKSLASKAKVVWLASDEDREGEAISWHLQQTLGLDSTKTHRIVFHEITKPAILNAIENPREVNNSLVMAQQARRVLDRLVGFELSPILWKKIRPSLSAGRVQSVALRLIVEREREINSFESKRYYKVEGSFTPEGSDVAVSGSVEHRFAEKEKALAFLESCLNACFSVSKTETKELSRVPAAPFTTSSLQQEASRKYGFSVNQTMTIAQHLYESGMITYMRTDSTNLSSLATGVAKKVICETYGEKYHQFRRYKTSSKGAQEAHEAIRPTDLERTEISGTAPEKKLYDLIWKRTIASQMSSAVLERTDLEISAPEATHPFHAQGKRVIFDGFLKVYIEGRDDEQDEDLLLLPALKVGTGMSYNRIEAVEKYTTPALRYTEASLVKKMEELGIGRPSTYAPTISTLHAREYIVKKDCPGTSRQIERICLEKGKLKATVKTEVIGKENGKLCPENIGIMVTDFLEQFFPDIMDYGFTAKVEEDFDRIATGELVWNSVISDFYAPFHDSVCRTEKEADVINARREIGIDPKTGKKVIARVGKYGPLVQLGEDDDPARQFSSLGKGQLIESLTLEQACALFELPRNLGSYKNQEVICSKGKYGPYIKYNGGFISLPKGADPFSFTYEQAVALIEQNAASQANKTIKEFSQEGIQVLNGRYGPYIKKDKDTYRIPKSAGDPKNLSLEACMKIISESASKKK
ncbi:MAG: type I DNA topoisomerase [Bacteroidales bacterium]|nr:type I DNA topoisomerase [Bacteroidales bacterium]